MSQKTKQFSSPRKYFSMYNISTWLSWKHCSVVFTFFFLSKTWRLRRWNFLGNIILHSIFFLQKVKQILYINSFKMQMNKFTKTNYYDTQNYVKATLCCTMVAETSPNSQECSKFVVALPLWDALHLEMCVMWANCFLVLVRTPCKPPVQTLKFFPSTGILRLKLHSLVSP